MTIVLFAADCGGGGNTPTNIEKSIYNQFIGGNYEKAATIMINNLDTTLSEEDKALYAEFMKKEKESHDAKGGVKSYDVVAEIISEDGLFATTETKIVFGDGSEDNNTTNYVKKDGVWKISSGK
jgi:hypothetical protein